MGERRLDLSGSRWVLLAWCCDHGNETSSFVKYWGISWPVEKLLFHCFPAFSFCDWSPKLDVDIPINPLPVKKFTGQNNLIAQKGNSITVLLSHCHECLLAQICYICICVSAYVVRKKHWRNFPVFRKFPEFSCGVSEFQTFYWLIRRFVTEPLTRHSRRYRISLSRTTAVWVRSQNHENRLQVCW